MPAASQLHPNEQTFCDDGTRVLFVPIVLQKSENARVCRMFFDHFIDGSVKRVRKHAISAYTLRTPAGVLGNFRPGPTKTPDISLVRLPL
jgi:hypothetical protein